MSKYLHGPTYTEWLNMSLLEKDALFAAFEWLAEQINAESEK